MESLQEAINSCFFGDNLDMQLIEQGFITTTTQHDLRFEEEVEVEVEVEEDEEELEEAQYISVGLEDNRMPFLQMLQTINDFPPNSSTNSDYFSSSKEPSFQALLRLQHFNNNASQINSLEALESCVTQDHPQQQLYDSPPKSEDRQQTNPIEVSSLKMSPHHNKTQFIAKSGSTSTPVAATRRRRKRKRTRPAKNKEELESQRMTHIAVERNRRRQMNDHLSVLRSLMPPSYIQRGDQASIVGGAIDFVKELEQHLQTLEAHKRMRGVAQGFVTDNVDDPSNNSVTTTTTTSSNSPSFSSAVSTMPSNGMFMSLSQCRIGCNEEGINNYADGITAQNKSEAAEVDVTVIETHVNLKVQCQKRLGQLVRVLVAFEDIRLTVLHLNITSSQDKVLYSFNLKIEEGCKLGSADEIARGVHQIFSFINGS